MATVNVNFRLDKEVKEEMEKACEDMGLTMSAAFTIFAKTVVRERRIPFAVTADPFYSEANMHYLDQKMSNANKLADSSWSRTFPRPVF